MTVPKIAVVGLGCRYPDVDSPAALWETVLAGRRAFRRLPDERMRREDYYSPDPAAPDRFYAAKAAVIEGFEFDRVKYRVAGSTFRSTDMTHWLALDTAARALQDAGFSGGAGLAGRLTGVVLGNSLTGEFSRANQLRLRWPYVRRTVGAALRGTGWDDARLADFLAGLEQRYKAAFPEIDEDTLAGGLSNTIAGRICNHFDFKGGGYTVDGACSSSLLAVATAANALAAGQLDVAVAGGVDLSIDPFEVIGFARTGALATGVMKVYDRGSNGFWPGEGCGVVVLMRDEDARAEGRFRYATVAGWGYSSDGRGGITRPEADGHRQALRRAYAAAGFGIDTVGYLEGHGTGTAVGDATELRAFSAERRAADPDAAPAAISTVKGNFGHTKAAAGAAGLIKAVLAVHHQVIPPATSHVDPHPELSGERPALRVPDRAQLWPGGAPVRAGVSSMGFGGINAHVVVEHGDSAPRTALDDEVLGLVRSRQDTEILLLDADGPAELRGRVAHLAALCEKLSYAELGDLAAALQRELAGRPLRAAVVAAAPEEAAARFGRMLALLDDGARGVLDQAGGVYLGAAGRAPRIGLLFPGQGAGRRTDGGALRRRFAAVDELYDARPLPPGADPVDTAVAQPRIALATAAALRVLAALGIEAHGAVGHSLGELAALHWAGAVDEAGLLDLAAARGAVMAAAGRGGGTMAGLAAPPEQVEPLLAELEAVIAGYNGPRQTVVSGTVDAVGRVGERARSAGIDVSPVAVSHAFHSPLVAPAAELFAERLAGHPLRPLPAGLVHSTVTGGPLPEGTDLRELLTRQITAPVRFEPALRSLAERSDLLVEAGPGGILRGLAAQTAPAVPVVSMDADSPSLAGALAVAATAYCLGAPVRHEALFAGRFTRALALDKEFRFFASPCESAPPDEAGVDGLEVAVASRPADAGFDTNPGSDLATGAAAPVPAGAAAPANGSRPDSLEVLLRLAAQRAELPPEAVGADSNPLDDLHLSSITVGHIVNEACRELGVGAPAATSAYATSSLAEIAALLDSLDSDGRAGPGAARRDSALGVGPWVRAFSVDLVPADPGVAVRTGDAGRWTLFAPDHHPLAPALYSALRRAGLGDGVLLCLARDCDESSAGLMLQAARAALSAGGAARFVTVGDRRGAAGLAKTLHLEHPDIAVTVVTVPLAVRADPAGSAALAERIVADVAATTAFSEVCYDAAGVRSVPVLRPLQLSADRAPASPLGPADVLLVTGGGKGITAECALVLGRDTGAAVGLMGRSDPAADPELAANLERMAAAGLRCHYTRADITAPDQVKAAVGEVDRELGPITAVLHGAGRNEPHALADLDEDSFKRTLAPKVAGLESVLAAVDAANLRLLVGFGSIIGRAGLRGEADYATANDWLTDLVRRVGAEYPRCRCLSVEWSVWSGTGMGARLGVLEALIDGGIEPIPPDEGAALLARLVADPAARDGVVVMGRAEGLPTLALEQRQLPLLRFLDRPRVHYPQIELVVDTELSGDGDLYLPDHLLDGDLLFPAVFGMEAMAQAGSALVGPGAPTVLEQVEFLRPIVVPPQGATTVRVAVLAEDGDAVRAVVRSEETGFQADHFRAVLRYGPPGLQADPQPESRQASSPKASQGPELSLDPAADLYGSVLFQGARFQRVLGYRALAAKSCTVRIDNTGRIDQPGRVDETGRPGPAAPPPWFAAFLPDGLVAGDPGTRDAFMHAIQCCVPDATLLPSGVDRLYPADPAAVAGEAELVLSARERLRDGDSYTYDLDVHTAAGRLVERWEGLRLQAVRKLDGSGPWAPALLGPYLERRTEPLLGRELRCAVEPNQGPDILVDGAGPGARGTSAARRRRSARALGRLLGPGVTVRYRPDGAPEAADGTAVSASHGAGVTFAVAAPGGRVACDVEEVRELDDAQWLDLLGAPGLDLARLLAAEAGEDLDVAATRVWGAAECLVKVGRAVAGLAADGPARGDGWAVLRAGTARIATFPTRLRGTAQPVVFSMLTEGSR